MSRDPVDVNTDPAELYALAAGAFAGQVAGIAAAGLAWDGRGLGDLDLRALVGHTSRSLVTVDTYLDKQAASVDLPDAVSYVAGVTPSAMHVDPADVAERGRAAGRALGDDPASAVAELADRVVARVRAIVAAGEDPAITTIGGGMRLSDYLPTRVFELVVHGHDLAAATGLPVPAYPAEVLELAVTLAAAAAARQGRAAEVLTALTGRTSLPPGFTVT